MLLLAQSDRRSGVSAEVSLFDSLVRAGEELSFVELPLVLHTFLVGRLQKRVRDPDVIQPALALDLLSAPCRTGTECSVLLERTGDGALLLAGLFPERARRLHVSRTYFRHMGQAAYGQLAARFHATGRREHGELYDTAASHFMLLELVLNGARKKKHDLTWKEFMERQRYLMSVE